MSKKRNAGAITKVGKIATQIRGVTYSKHEVKNTPHEGYVPILRAMNITENGLTYDGLVYVPAAKVHERQLLQPGDIVVAVSSGSLEIVGKASVVETPVAASFGAFCKVVRPGPEVYPSYLGHFFRTPEYRSIISKLAQGANINNLKKEHIDDLKIPLPPLDEQKRIAALLDKVDALRRQRQESLKLTEKLLQSVFIEMFVRNPHAADWTPQTVKWMAKATKGSIRTGPFGSQLLHSEFVDRGIAVLGIDNAVKNRFEWGQTRFITVKKYQGLKRYKVFPGDLVITIMGTLGRCAIVPSNIPDAINTKHLCCVTLDQTKCIPDFLHAVFLNHPDVLRQMGVRCKGAVMPGLNIGIIKDLEIPMPPIELQMAFKRIADLCKLSRTDLEESHAFADTLFSSLQQRAFQGELDLTRLILDSKASKDEALQSDIQLLDAILEKGEKIPWSPSYFRYRIPFQMQAKFTFDEIMTKVHGTFQEPEYDEIRDAIFELLDESNGIPVLTQYFECRFDKATSEYLGRQQMIFSRNQ